jgi:bifunctional non-homologous end joining protein LigD
MAGRPTKSVAEETDALATYRAKRDFSKTDEPSGATEPTSGNAFLVQKHEATRLHYDFRLELDGVLKSWAVTRGPSLNPDDKRLAVRTEDHPLDYASFEGTIPKGQYGGGTVMLWDTGTWKPIPGKDPSKTLAEGHLHFILHGHRMKGEWIMIRLKPRGKEKGENWLLRKIADEYAAGSDDLVSAHLTGVASGLSMAGIAAGKKAKRKPAKTAKPTPERKSAAPSKAATPTKKPPPFRPVQLATLVDSVPAGNRWIHEMKYDGYRTLVAVGGGEARAYTRSGLDWSNRFPNIIAEAARLKVKSALIDGEAVVLDADERSSFQALQGALKGAPATIDYFAFDLLELDGEDLTDLPLLERKERLRSILPSRSTAIRYSDHIQGNGEKLLHSFRDAGLEGVISKLATAKYVGSRSGSWVKTKCIKRQEFVVVGWTPSDKSRAFRSLILGIHEDGKLRYAGKVGTGFDTAELLRLMELMSPLEQKTATVDAPRAEVGGAHWLKPKLVAEIAFTEMTNEGTLRHPSYLGLREDKRAEAVVLEKAQHTGNPPEATTSNIKVSNHDRVIYPETHITKGQLADHYAAVAGIMLPWAGSRPISLVRCPQGRAKKCFFQKHDAGSFGDHVHHVIIAEKDGHQEPYLYVDDADGLVTCVQMGTIEFHGWGARIEDVEKADRLVFDLDPDEGLDFEAVRTAAFHFRDILQQIGLATFPMITGGKGVHVIAPLVPRAEWPEVKDFAHRLAQAVAQSDPENFTAALPKAQRKGRIFVDYLRNQRGATAIMPYSARARPGAPVAAPISWKEMETIETPARYHIGDAAELVKRASSKALSGWGRADQSLPDL